MKKNDVIQFLIGFLSVITLFVLFSAFFDKKSTKKTVMLGDDNDDIMNLQKDRDAIAGDMWNAYNKLSSQYVK